MAHPIGADHIGRRGHCRDRDIRRRKLDGADVATWHKSQLGPHLGYLPQAVELFDGTIAENIARFGSVDPEGVVDAATRTGIHDMVLRFPKGYDTPMGEAGSLLIASPVYWFTFSAQTKLFMDRLYAFVGPSGWGLAGKRIGIALTYADPDPFVS